MKPFSEACEQNKDPILNILRRVFANNRYILEIGSGTGQHAVYFALQLPHLVWQTSDKAENHPGINEWVKEANLPNVLRSIDLDVDQHPWPTILSDAIFSANTTHIMSWAQVTNMFRGISSVLTDNGIFCLYGPFNRDGEYTSESNARFDDYLKHRDPLSGLRDIKDLEILGEKYALKLIENIEMPVNNRMLIWKKII